jgi:transketolase
MRDAFSTCLTDAATANPKVRLLTGDHGYALFDSLRKKCPNQFINAGVAEQNMIGVAAGLAKTGFLPIVYGLSAFVPIRVLEQIKLDLCYENLPVVLVGDGAGVVYSALGASHQSTEDIAALRAIPNLIILSPADEYEMREAFAFALNAGKTVYLRMGKSDLGSCHVTDPKLEVGRMLQVKEGNSPTAFIATGSMVHLAIQLKLKLFINSPVWSAPFIKPLERESLHRLLSQHKQVVVLEEHSVFGGLGSAVAELASEKAGTRVVRIGIDDRFSKFCGSYSYLMKEHGLDFDSVVGKLKRFQVYAE